MKKNVTIKRTNKKISILLCICMLLAVCLGIPASADSRPHYPQYSTSNTLDKVNITGFMGQSMLEAYAVKTGSGEYAIVTGQVNNLNITKYKMYMEMSITVSYGMETRTFDLGRTVSTQTGAPSLSVDLSYQTLLDMDATMEMRYEFEFASVYMKVDSTCPYPYDLPYTDEIWYPVFY